MVNVAVGKLMGETGKDALTCESELLNGQSAQGILSSKDIYGSTEVQWQVG